MIRQIRIIHPANCLSDFVMILCPIVDGVGTVCVRNSLPRNSNSFPRNSISSPRITVSFQRNVISSPRNRNTNSSERNSISWERHNTSRDRNTISWERITISWERITISWELNGGSVHYSLLSLPCFREVKFCCVRQDTDITVSVRNTFHVI